MSGIPFYLRFCNSCFRSTKDKDVSLSLTPCHHHLCNECVKKCANQICIVCQSKCITFMAVNQMPDNLKFLYKPGEMMFRDLNLKELVPFKMKQLALFTQHFNEENKTIISRLERMKTLGKDKMDQLALLNKQNVQHLKDIKVLPSEIKQRYVCVWFTSHSVQ